jgi:hypothetical protein
VLRLQGGAAERSGLILQLTFEGFAPEQAEHGVRQAES